MTTTTASLTEADIELQAINRNAQAQRRVGYMAALALFFTVAAAQIFVKLISLALDPQDPGVLISTGQVANYVWWLLICLTAVAASIAYGLRLRRLLPA